MGAKTNEVGAESIFITGFPGFLATHVLHRILDENPETSITALVLPRDYRLARERADRLRQTRLDAGSASVEFELVRGDITAPNLGLADDVREALVAKTTSIWHFAAIYDLGVDEDVAYAVNVGGTANVLQLAAEAAREGQLRRFVYLSTCYVAGERAGTIFEDELDEGQKHHNHYESTKFWAEMEVRRRADEVPSVILRPAITVGDSRTGATDKFDGLYYVFRALRKLPRWVRVPNLLDDSLVANIIPVDFATAAIATIGLDDESVGKTFHIADPHPMPASEILSHTVRLMRGSDTFGRLPGAVVEAALGNRSFEELVGVPREVSSYFTSGARYDTSNTTAALAKTSIRCPHLSTYLQMLVDYFDTQPEQRVLDGRKA